MNEMIHFLKFWISILLFSALLALLVFKCKDKDPLPSIEGEWVQTAPASPGWVFVFKDGLVTQRAKGFGATLSTLTFPYSEFENLVYIGGDANNLPRTWVVTMLGDMDMKARQMPVDSSRVWEVLYFERVW